MKSMWLGIFVLTASTIVGCTGVPKGLEPVSDFDANRYLGKWYEIARLDHSFERNLSNVSAEYVREDKGYIGVLNRGYDENSGKWKQIKGKARFIGEESVGSLKVSFFGPFYGGYHVIALDKEDYNYAMVAGPSRSYLWILSRTTFLDPNIYSGLIRKAAEMGFNTDELIKVRHYRHSENLKKESGGNMISSQKNMLAPCPQSPNCVSSFAENKRHYIEPIRYNGEDSQVRDEILNLIHSVPGTRLIKSGDRYIHAEFMSSIFKFIDDVEFYFDTAEKLVHVKSASRTGYYDWGVNRRRIENIRTKLTQKEITGQQDSESKTVRYEKI